MIVRACGVVVAVLAISGLSGCVAHAAGHTLTDVDGHTLTLGAPARGALDLLFIVGTDCPISNRYAPEIARICHDYQPKGVRCVLVYPDPTTTADAVKKHRSDYGFSAMPAVLDRQYALTDATHARVTPEAALFSSSGLAYHGRIDDQNPELGKVKREATRHDLREALDQLLSGKPVTVPETPAVGCYIERVK